MVVNQPLVAHGVGGQDVDDLIKPGWQDRTVDQSGNMALHQPHRQVPRSILNPLTE